MGEAMPDPSLPIFGEATVSYTIMHPRQEPDSLGQGGDTAWEHIELPVDEIDNLDNPYLREALWSQHRALQTKDSPFPSPFAKPDGTYTGNTWVLRNTEDTLDDKRVFVQLSEETQNVRTFSAPSKLIGEIFTVDGPIKHEDYPAYLKQKTQEKLAQQKSVGFISRLLRRSR